MNRACKNESRGNGKLTVKAERSDGVAGPHTFDGRANKHAPPLKQVENKNKPTGKGHIVGRVP